MGRQPSDARHRRRLRVPGPALRHHHRRDTAEHRPRKSDGRPRADLRRPRGRELGRPRAAHPGPGHVAQAPRVHRGGALHRRPTDSDHAEASLPERPRSGDRLARLRDPGRDAHRSDVVLSRHRRAAAHLHLGLRDQRGLRRLLDDSVAGAAAGALHLGHLAVVHLRRQRAAGRARPAVQDLVARLRGTSGEGRGDRVAQQLLEVQDLHTQFFTRDGVVRAVDGVSFELAAGETLGIVGESGCGKSVTALSLMRLIPIPPGKIVKGSIVFDGADVLKMDDDEVRGIRGNNIAMIFQDPMTSLNPVLTISRQISEALELHLKMDKSEARKRTVELLDLVGIPGAKKRLDDYPHQFSGGMRQRVMIAMALSCNPKLILADEPTTALDVTIQAQILDLLKNLAREFRTAFILITHDLGVVAGMTQRIHVMYGGKIVEKADTAELFANPKMPYTWGLLRSIPRLDERRKAKLLPIEGLPPDLIAPPPGCRFEPRCQYRREVCREKEPELVHIPNSKPDHEARCWGTQQGGWLVDTDWRKEVGDTRVLEEIKQEVAQLPPEPKPGDVPPAPTAI